MGANEEHLDVVRNLYDYEFKNGVSNQSLSRYFDKAFQSVVDQHRLVPGVGLHKLSKTRRFDRPMGRETIEMP